MDTNHFYRKKMSQKLPVSSFKQIKSKSKFNENFIKIDNWDSDKAYFLERDVYYSEKLHELQNDLPLLPERITTENVEKKCSDFAW